MVNGNHRKTSPAFPGNVGKNGETTRMPVEKVLYWCVSAKNEMTNNSGYSPNQWVLGQHTMVFNPTSRDNVRLPELGEDNETGTMFTDMMNMRKEAAIVLITAEFDERIQRAVRRRPNPFQRLPAVGDRVLIGDNMEQRR